MLAFILFKDYEQVTLPKKMIQKINLSKKEKRTDQKGKGKPNNKPN